MTADASAFFNLVNLLLAPQDSQPQIALPQTRSLQQTAGSPAQIADGIIRSMLADSAGVSSSSVSSNNISSSNFSNDTKPGSKKPSGNRKESERPATKHAPGTAPEVSANIVTIPPQVPAVIPPAEAPASLAASAAIGSRPAASVESPAEQSKLTQPEPGPVQRGDGAPVRSTLDLAFGARLTPKQAVPAGEGPLQGADGVIANSDPKLGQGEMGSGGPGPGKLESGAPLSPKQVAGAAMVAADQAAISAPQPGDAADSKRDHPSDAAPHTPGPEAGPESAKRIGGASAESVATAPDHLRMGPSATFATPVAATTPNRAATPPPAVPAAPRITEASPIMPSSNNPSSSNSSPVQAVVVRVAPAGAAPVEVQVHQRQGEMHVAVRTPDQELKTSLRQDLPELVNALDRAGFHAETFTPHAVNDLLVASPTEAFLGGSPQDSSGSSAQGRGAFENGSSGWAGGQQQQQQRQREQLQQSWLEQMEE